MELFDINATLVTTKGILLEAPRALEMQEEDGSLFEVRIFALVEVGNDQARLECLDVDDLTSQFGLDQGDFVQVTGEFGKPLSVIRGNATVRPFIISKVRVILRSSDCEV